MRSHSFCSLQRFIATVATGIEGGSDSVGFSVWQLLGAMRASAKAAGATAAVADAFMAPSGRHTEVATRSHPTVNASAAASLSEQPMSWHTLCESKFPNLKQP